MVARADLQAYFDEARTFEADRLRAAIRHQRIAYVVAGAACVLCVVLGLALVSLAPLKRVEPFVIRVDDSTGMVDVVTALKDAGTQTYEEAVSKYFLAQYVRSRAGYSADERAHNFTVVSLLSTPAEQQVWATYFNGKEPDSPQVKFAIGGRADVTVRSIAFLSDKVATVRFTLTTKREGQTSQSFWIATISFAYANAPMAEADRFINPLGFQVSNYRADAEVIQ